MTISGGLVGSYSQLGRTLVVVDENGNELTGVIVSQETLFTAHDNDVREGMVYASDEGVSTGTKVIPTYNTYQGLRVIPAGSALTLLNQDAKIDSYDYTKLQAIVCAFNTNLSDSVGAHYVSIDDVVYAVQSTDSTSTVVKNHDSKIVDFGMVNNSDSTMIIRYFMYKEIE